MFGRLLIPTLLKPEGRKEKKGWNRPGYYLRYFNIVSNFFIYCVTVKSFRESLKKRASGVFSLVSTNSTQQVFGAVAISGAVWNLPRRGTMPRSLISRDSNIGEKG